MHFFKILKKFGPVLPCVIVAAMAGGSLAGYRAPVPVGNAQVAEAASRTKTGKAKKTSEDTTKGTAETPAVTMTVSPTPTAAEETSADVSTGEIDLQKIPDGTYEGTGRGFQNGVTTARVTVRNHKIVAVNIIGNHDTAEFFNRAESTVINEILGQQSADVDAVSGATMSSRGIKEAVANALKKGMGQKEGRNKIYGFRHVR